MPVVLLPVNARWRRSPSPDALNLSSAGWARRAGVRARHEVPLDPNTPTGDSGPVEATPAGHRRATIHLLPRTRLGFWAVRFLFAFAVFFLTICALVATGQRGLWLVSLVIPLFLLGLLAGATGAVAVVRRGERSLLVFLPLVVGILLAIFLLGELVGPE